MQVLDEKKRANILAAAARLFAEHPFHKVLLSSVAEEAGVGKGTLYHYFRNKEELYLSVLFDGFANLVERLSEMLESRPGTPEQDLRAVVDEIAGFAMQSPHLFEVLRTAPGLSPEARAAWQAKRRELSAGIERVIRRGIREGVFHDAHPEWTARYVTGLVRAVFLDGTEGLVRDEVAAHIGDVLMAWLRNPGA